MVMTRNLMMMLFYDVNNVSNTFVGLVAAIITLEVSLFVYRNC
jgi:hypothetical protein